MERDIFINVLLIIAGILLAIALFGAGVIWRSGTAQDSKLHSPAPFLLRTESSMGCKGRYRLDRG